MAWKHHETNGWSRPRSPGGSVAVEEVREGWRSEVMCGAEFLVTVVFDWNRRDVSEPVGPYGWTYVGH